MVLILINFRIQNDNDYKPPHNTPNLLQLLTGFRIILIFTLKNTQLMSNQGHLVVFLVIVMNENDQTKFATIDLKI